MLQSWLVLCFAAFVPWVSAQTLELRTAGRDSEPMFIFKDGTVSGVCPDIYAALERVDKTLKISGAGRMLSLPLAERGLRDGTMDINCSFGRSAQRDTYLRYPVEITRSNMVVAVRTADPLTDIKDMQELVELSKDGNPIIVRRGSIFGERLNNLGAVVDDQSADNDANIAKLINSRGRFFYHIDYLMEALIKEPGTAGKMRILPTPIEPIVTYIVLSKKLDARTDARIQEAIAKLRKSGELQIIFAKYGIGPGDTPRPLALTK